MADKYPSAAYGLLLTAGILDIINGALAVFMVGWLWLPFGYWGDLGGFLIIATCMIWFIIWGVLFILSAMWVKTGDKDKVHKGAVLGLVASILGGFNIISLIGAILAFTWKPPAPAYVPPPPPT